MTDHPPKNVLLIYKKSRYQNYYLEKRQIRLGLKQITDTELTHWKDAHDRHMQSLDTVRTVLDNRSVKFREVYRASAVRYDPHDLVVSVGGDGTFIEAARRIGEQPLLGVNSDPILSVGHYCSSNAESFEKELLRLLDGKATILPLNRLQLELNGDRLLTTALNDVLIAHHRPAALSRYRLSIGPDCERHSGSGIWVSTAMGSYGAMRSAGGATMPTDSYDLQYLPRELYERNGTPYRLKGGTVSAGTPITISSEMREGEISMDGCHCRLPFGYNSTLIIRNAPTPVNWVTSEP
jgi:NAD+ kinase